MKILKRRNFPNGSSDKNVFDIIFGICITFLLTICKLKNEYFMKEFLKIKQIDI